jgi:hypothetical protein
MSDASNRYLPAAVMMLTAVFLFSGEPAAQPPPTAKDPEQVLQEVQRELIELDSQFESIRKDLFFPKDSEVLIYLRSGLRENFPVKSIDLTLDNRPVYRHVYTDSERIAFNFSDLQPLYRMEVGPGDHALVARFTLADAKAEIREHRFTFRKESLPRFVEIEVVQDKKAKAFAFAERIW